jgi:glycosyltransferase involved in cell wall biosynthesis
LAGQQGFGEILVVENGPPSSTTEAIAERAQAKHLTEPRIGSGPARNRGLSAARYDLVVYIDDDCEAEEGWLETLLRPFEDEGVHAVAGQVLPSEVATPAARLFDRYFPYSKGLARRSFGPGPSRYPFPLNANEMGTGANMAFRRRTLCMVGGFVDALSAGGPARGGEDIHAFDAVLRAGHRLVYEPQAKVRHRHPDTAAEVHRVLFDYGVAYFAYLTHTLLTKRDVRVLRRMAAILVHYARRLTVPAGADLPRSYLLCHLAGSCMGPARYVAARRVYG